MNWISIRSFCCWYGICLKCLPFSNGLSYSADLEYFVRGSYYRFLTTKKFVPFFNLRVLKSVSLFTAQQFPFVQAQSDTICMTIKFEIISATRRSRNYKKKSKYLLLSFVLYFGCCYCYCYCCCVCIFFSAVLLQYWILFGCAFFFTSFFLYGPSVLYTNRKYDKIHTAHTFNDTIFDLFIILSSNLSRLYGFLRLNMLFHTKIISSVIIDQCKKRVNFFLRNFCNVVVVAFRSNWSEFHLEFTWIFLCDFFRSICSIFHFY